VTPYYQDEQVTLYHGDCLEIDAWLAADVLVTDPPYGIGWTRPVIRSTKGARIPNAGITNDDDTRARDAALTTWGDKPALCFGSLAAPYPADWKQMLVFGKAPNAGLFGNRRPWLRNWEPIFVLGNWPDQTPQRSSIIQTRWLAASGYRSYTTEAGHAHAKPLDVMEQLVNDCPPGTVADPFAGSGSTLIAARNLGRKAIGVEIEEKYCEIAAKRLDQLAFDFTPDPTGEFVASTMFTRGGTAAYEPLPLDGEASA
jgi:DNA modification methylase